MTNENCLTGIICPKCGSLEPFDIEIRTVTRMFDDGSDSQVGDQEWDAESYIMCCECNHHGTVADFAEEKESDTEAKA